MFAGFVTCMGLLVGSGECAGVYGGRVFYVLGGFCDYVYACSCGPIQCGLALL